MYIINGKHESVNLELAHELSKDSELMFIHPEFLDSVLSSGYDVVIITNEVEKYSKVGQQHNVDVILLEVKVH